LGFELPTEIDGRRKRLFIRGIMFTSDEFMSIDINKLFRGMPWKSLFQPPASL
jgi:hypothetical protein